MSTTELKIRMKGIKASGRNFSINVPLVAKNEQEPEIISAYFAEKKIENVKEAAGTYTYTFGGTNNTSTEGKKSSIATVILKKVNASVKKDKKYTSQALVKEKLKEDSYKKGDTVIIDLKQDVEKVSYPKITSAPMGYQVYLITETRNLKDKKARVKIYEKEEGLKLLKTKDDTLPVLVFARKEDTTTNTEASDWIEIDVKEENGKKEGGALVLHKEDKGDKIEVGIKKIQLRPKEDKIKAEGEDAHISFEGWQEALYIREDETEEGKKAKQEAEEKATARTAETFVNLTYDISASKVSYPKKISGPGTISLEKEAVYTIDTYGASANEEDKNNIRWSFYVQGDPKKTTADKEKTYINAKSKSGLYTYAKTELVANKNKLTLVFDKALVGKKVQIEAFRGLPDLNNKKDYVRTTTVEEDNKGSIVKKLDSTSLFLATECDSVKNAGEKNKKDFFKTSGFFKLKAKSLWTDPIKDSEITLYNFSGTYKPKGSTFGKVRLKWNKAKTKLVPKAHTGLDVFAEKGTDLFACLDGKVERIYGKSNDKSYGNVIVIEVDDASYLEKSKNKYIIKYPNEIEKGPSFDLKGKIYLRYAHVQKATIKVGDRVKSGDKIGVSGVTGNASGTKAPHLHFEIANLPRPGRGLVNRCNPAFYVNLRGENKANKSHQKKVANTKHKI
ncbi:M23 family metallopeptidase [Aquimarina sp. I32.4]|uniref:M23 family metallopeptidase n=1 Tax=Aquimarina sp. I32.4 TaxID=2053903 RepID=UPI0018EDBE86|nr:M23 family metallopeptidase [Aquimarina sp. I32.4]